MTVIEFTEKFAELESHIAEEKGPFALFALFMREDAPDRWDLIVSAPWAGDDKRSVVDYFVSQIKSRLGEQGLTSLLWPDRQARVHHHVTAAPGTGAGLAVAVAMPAGQSGASGPRSTSGFARWRDVSDRVR